MTDTAQSGHFERPGARERLAEALRDWGSLPNAYACLPYVQREAVLDALLPVVESLADERAAEALEEAASELRDIPTKGNDGLLIARAADRIDARAAALRGQS